MTRISPAISPAFEKLAAILKQEGGLDDAASPPSGRRRFGSAALKINGKIFAMPANGTLVIKLPKDRVDALVQSGAGAYYDPGHGRLMREWVSLHGSDHGSDANWLSLAREAREFVRTGNRGP